MPAVLVRGGVWEAGSAERGFAPLAWLRPSRPEQWMGLRSLARRLNLILLRILANFARIFLRTRVLDRAYRVLAMHETIIPSDDEFVGTPDSLVGWRFAFKVLLGFLVSASVLVAFQVYVDPYALVRPDLEYKQLPYPTYSSYNILKHANNLDVGFLGSSAVNYFDLDHYQEKTGKQAYSMGIESSNIVEHVTYGRVLADAGVKEIVFFITFYALNPDRPQQAYFNKPVCLLNWLPVDVVHQYCNASAIKESFQVLSRRRNGTAVTQQFLMNGSRTQRYYLDKKDYSFQKTVTAYVTALRAEEGYYGSVRFRDPDSIEPGIQQIRDYLAHLDKRGIRWRLASAPEHRSSISLIYEVGLGPTYERHREALASIAPFVDLNLDVELCSNDEAFWDTHHVRHGARVIDDLSRSDLVVTSENVHETAYRLRPSRHENEHLIALLNSSKVR